LNSKRIKISVYLIFLLNENNLERTLEHEKPGYGEWMPSVTDKMKDIIGGLTEKHGTCPKTNVNLSTNEFRVTQLKLRCMEFRLVTPEKAIALSADQMSLLVYGKKGKSLQPIQYPLNQIQVITTH
jgi:hypothetical protein